MNTVCFIVTSFWAFGELNIALDFARRITNDGYAPVFIIPPSHEAILKENKFYYEILIPNSRNLNLVLLKEVQYRYSPKAVILADFLNYAFCERHYGLTLEDLEIFSGKIGTFDLYDYQNTGSKVDTYGFQAKNMRELTLDPYEFLLQPCPVNHISSFPSAKIFRYSLFGNCQERMENEREQAREKLKIRHNECMVLMTSATWQQTYRPYQNIQPFITICNRVVQEMVKALPDNYKVFSVGARSLFLNGQAPARFVHYEKMMPAEFHNLLMAADIYLSNNFISTSMIKIVLTGIPTLLLQNSFLKRNNNWRWVNDKRQNPPKILENCALAYPFRMFPVGWYRFLEPIVRRNPFFSLMSQEELFDSQQVISKIISLAENKTDPFRELRIAYRKRLKALSEPATVLDEIIKPKVKFKNKELIN